MYDSLMNVVSKEKYSGNTVGDRLLGFGSTLVPQCGYSGFATVLPFVIGSLFANAGINIDMDSVVKSLPQRDKIQDLVTDVAVDNILLTRQSIRKNNNIFFPCDKGNKKGNKNLSKIISWFDVDERKVKTFLLDVNCTDESSNKIADAVGHSLTGLFPNENDFELKLRGQCTDSGGGGTLQSLARELDERNLISISIPFAVERANFWYVDVLHKSERKFSTIILLKEK